MKRLFPVLFFLLIVAGLLLLFSSCGKSGDSLSPQTGVGGSMARFAITGNTLYIVSKQTLEVYNIANGAEPTKTTSKDIDVGIETIFPYSENLFIGSTSGMYIFENKTPSNPVLLSQYSHVQSCDPVVVQGQYAYVTLRGGTECRRGATFSSLDVIDISDLRKPKMIETQRMDTPYGLGVSGNKLFVCEGDFGLKIMDVSNPASPVFARQFKDVAAYDVIALQDRLILTGKNGLYQYHFDETDKMELLSKIPVE